MAEPVERGARLRVRAGNALGSPLSALARRAVHAGFRRIEAGEVVLHEDGRVLRFGRATDEFPLSVEVYMHAPEAYGRILLGGSIGAGEAYMAGLWSCSDLVGLMRIMSRNLSVLARMEVGWARLAAPARSLFKFLRANTPGGSRRNIAAHYDLSNDFFKLFLDETMTYSCAYFESGETPLREASIEKYDRICRKLGLSRSDSVLEVGCGWGGFAVHAASRYGCRVTGTTISREQYDYACERVRAAGLGERVTILFEDYRDLTGTFDKLVSIEMIEAVGHRNYDNFFRVCSDRLKPDGMMALQAITIVDHAFRRQTRTVDFIKRYIFPGSCIPSVAAMMESVSRATDLRPVHLEDITPHYARTLREWRERFFANIDGVRALGLPESFIRMWEYYLCYCEGGFEERYIGDVQMVLAKPLSRPSCHEVR